MIISYARNETHEMLSVILYSIRVYRNLEDNLHNTTNYIVLVHKFCMQVYGTVPTSFEIWRDQIRQIIDHLSIILREIFKSFLFDHFLVLIFDNIQEWNIRVSAMEIIRV